MAASLHCELWEVLDFWSQSEIKLRQSCLH